MLRRTLVLVSLAALLLAGCSSAPPAGTLVNTNYTISTAEGMVKLTYTPFSPGGNPTGVVPIIGPMTQCVQGVLIGQIPPPAAYPPNAPVQPCTPASTNVLLMATLPNPGSSRYNAYFVGGTAGEASIGELADSGAGAYMVNKTFDSDLNNQHAGVEVRLNGYVVATSPATGGDQALAIAPVSGIAAVGAFEGPKLTLKLSGLADNGTFVGRLYTKDDKGVLAVAEAFPVKNGEVVFMAKKDVALYAEFHIHVGDSSLNLYKATVTPAK